MLSQQIKVNRVSILSFHWSLKHFYEYGELNWFSSFIGDVFDVFLLEVTSPDVTSFLIFDIDHESEAWVKITWSECTDAHDIFGLIL